MVLCANFEPERRFYHGPVNLPAFSYYGGSVAIDDETVLIGAYLRTRDQTDSGAAYLIDRASGEQIAELRPDTPAGSESFGLNVALWKGIAIVGCAIDAARGNSGALYLFDAATGEQLDVITPDDTDSSDYFGAHFDILGDHIAVTAAAHNFPGLDSGRIYLYDLNTMSLVRVFTDSNPEDSTIGREIALTDRHVLTLRISIRSLDPDDTTLVVYDRQTGDVVGEAVPTEGRTGGEVVTLDASNRYALIGDPNSDLPDNPGGVLHVFDLDTLEFVRAFGPQFSGGRSFGFSIDVEGDYAAISDAGVEHLDPILQGAVDIYDMRSWSHVTTVLPERNPLFGYAEYFGTDIALTRTGLLAGVPDAWPHAQYVPVPELCPADVNGDCLVDTADFTAWVGAFNNDEPQCDQNGDGMCTPTDFSAWITNYNAGC